MILLLSSLSACGLIKNKDSGGSSNQDGNGLTIQGTTSWLIDVMAPSTFAQEALPGRPEKRTDDSATYDTPELTEKPTDMMPQPGSVRDLAKASCPKGFYASTIGLDKTRAAPNVAAPAATAPAASAEADQPVGFAGPIAEPAATVDVNACPNSVTTCDSDSGTCAFLYSISETDGQNLVCVVPVDKNNKYQFHFTEHPGMKAGKIVITSAESSSIVVPDSCFAQKNGRNLKGGIEDLIGRAPEPGIDARKRIDQDQTSASLRKKNLSSMAASQSKKDRSKVDYECLPNPVQYREITFTVQDNVIVADANPDSTIVSGMDSAILQAPSETLREGYKKAKEEILKKIKERYGEKPDFDDSMVISQFTDSSLVQKALNSSLALDVSEVEKIKKEMEQKISSNLESKNPEKVSHFVKNQNLLNDLMNGVANNLAEDDSDGRSKIEELKSELSEKQSDIEAKVVEIQFDLVKDPSNFDKRKKKKVDDLANLVSGVPTKASTGGNADFKAAFDLEDNNQLPLRNETWAADGNDACSLDEDSRNLASSEYDIDSQMKAIEEAHQMMAKARDEKNTRNREKFEKLNVTLKQNIEQLRKMLSQKSKDSDEQPKIDQVINGLEKDSMDLAKQLKAAAPSIFSAEAEGISMKLELMQAYQKAYEMALIQLQTAPNKVAIACVNCDESKGESIAEEYKKMIERYKNEVTNLTVESKRAAFKIKISTLDWSAGLNSGIIDYYQFKIKVRKEQDNSTSAEDSALKALQTEQDQIKKDMAQTKKDIEAFDQANKRPDKDEGEIAAAPPTDS